MPPSEDPFNDPELQREMRRLGVVHKPGMAAELMRELAPLLKAEGIDLDDPDADYNLDQLNAAMAVATAQHNLRLSTPVGNHRALALRVLRESAVSIAEGNLNRAAALIDHLPPEASDSQPSAAHVLGAGLGVLDTWMSDAQTAVDMRGARMLKWPGGAMRAVATELFALAQKSRAFDSQGSFIMRHGGLVVSRATALALGSALARFASQQRLEVSAAADKLFGTTGAQDLPTVPASSAAREAPTAAQHSGAAFGLQRRPQFSLELLEAFERWLDPSSSPGEEPHPFVRQAITLFETLIGEASHAGLDLEDPEDIDAILDLMFELEDDVRDRDGWDLHRALEVLHEYVEFRQRESMFGEDWVKPRLLIEEALRDLDPVPSELYEAIETSDDLPDAQRWQAFFQLNIVQGISLLLDWLGTSRPITPTGMPRRADIETVAAFIGISAKGAAKLPPFVDRMQALYAEQLDSTATPEPLLVTSVNDLPVLAAWWQALLNSEIIERRGTRIRPGRAAALWAQGSESEHNFDAADSVVTIFTVEILTHRVINDRYGFAVPVALDTIGVLIDAVVGRESDQADGDPRAELYRSGAHSLLKLLEQGNVVSLSGESVRVAAELHAAVGNAVILVMELLARHLGTDD